MIGKGNEEVEVFIPNNEGDETPKEEKPNESEKPKTADEIKAWRKKKGLDPEVNLDELGEEGPVEEQHGLAQDPSGAMGTDENVNTFDKKGYF